MKQFLCSIKMLFMKKIILLISLSHIVFSLSICAQQTGVHIDFKDAHTENVTRILVHPNGNYFFTGDNAGKIMMWRTRDYSYVRTLSQGAPGMPVRDMRLTQNGKVLLVSEGMQGRGLSDKPSPRYGLSNLYQDFDTLSAYYPFDERLPVRRNVSFDILGHEFDSINLLAFYEDVQGALYGFDKVTGQEQHFYYPLDKPVHKAAVDTRNKRVAFCNYDIINEVSALGIYQYNSSDTLYEKEFKSDILELVFDDTLPILHIITYDSEKQTISIFEYDFDKNKLTESETITTGSLLYPYVYTQKTDGLSVIIDTEFIQPIVFKKNKGSLKKETYPYPMDIASSTASGFIPETHHMIYWTQIHNYYGCNPELHVYDYEAGVPIEKYTLKTRNTVSGAFLPGNNWYITGNEAATSTTLFGGTQTTFIKYYTRGTLRNRFGRLNLKDYMAINHTVELTNDTRFVVDEEAGLMAFAAYPAGTYKSRYYIYDLINDAIDSSLTETPDFAFPLAYRNKSKHLLAGDFVSFEGTRNFAVIAPQKTVRYDGAYTDAILSNEGSYILLCDINGKLIIYEAGKKKAVFEKNLGKINNLKMGAIDENAFRLSFSYWEETSRNTAQKSLILEHASGKFIEQEYPNTILADVAFKNDVSVILFDNYINRTVFISEERFLTFNGSENPVKISLNDDASILMVIFDNGTTALYNTLDMSLRGKMLHPDSRSHIILTPAGYYSANTSAETYLYGMKDDDILTSAQLDLLFNKPSEVISVFGTPDVAYQAMLDKTSAIQLSRLELNLMSTDTTARRPTIQSILFDNTPSLSVTPKSTVTLTIEAESTKGYLNEAEIKVNGSSIYNEKLNLPAAHNKKASIRIEVPLQHGENNLSVRVINSDGNPSEVYEHFLLCTAPDNTSELYVLTIGISDYENTAYNLTFADKDAIDLAVLYSDTTVADIRAFKNKFFGERFRVNTYNNADAGKEIRFLGEGYGGTHFFNFVQQIDYKGLRWIEKAYEDVYHLWDFDNGARESIVLPGFNYSSYSLEQPFTPSVDGTGFYYKDDTGKWLFFNFIGLSSESTSILPNSKFFSINEGAWASDSVINAQEGYAVIVSVYNKKGKVTEQTTIPFEGFLKPELHAVSPDGKKFLIALYDELWLVEKNKTDVSKSRIEGLKHVMYNNSYFFDSTGTFLNCLHQVSEEEGYSYTIFHYNTNKKKNEETFIKYAFNTYNGINNTGGTVRWIGVNPPVGKDRGSLISSYLDDYNSLKPVSFKQVHVKALTNQEATASNITAALETFFSKAGPNDQIILFMAGHGVLDASLSYWFAPHDMDFVNPQANGIGYNSIIALLNKAKAVRKLLIMDSCHAGDIFEKDNKTLAESKPSDKDKRGASLIEQENSHEEKVSEIMAQLFNNVSSGSGITVLTASAGTDVAYESAELSNGAFTTALIEGLESAFKNSWGQINTEAQKQLQLDDSFIYQLQKRVITATQSRQIPNVREVNKLSGLKLW